MKKDQSIQVLSVTAILILFGLLVYNANKLITAAKYKQDLQYQVFSALSSKGKIDNIGDSIIDWLAQEILDIETIPSARQQELRQNIKSILITKNEINHISIDFIIMTVVLMAFSFGVRRLLTDLGLAMLLVSLTCLWVGLSSPILSIEASQDLPLVGKAVFQYESKSIIGSIHKLLEQKNLLLAYMLLGFSVILPLLKTISLTLFHILQNFKIQQRLSLWFSHLGKWSMTDVFVVAILVVFFAAGNDSSIKSVIETGLCFFASYVVLSLTGSIILAVSRVRPVV